MGDHDEIGKVIPAFLMKGSSVDADEVLEKAGIDATLLPILLDILLEEGVLERYYGVYCIYCGEPEGSYQEEYNMPSRFTCFYCGERQSLEEADVRVLYPMVKPLT